MKLHMDLCAFCDNGGIKKKISTIFLNPCFHSVCLYRLSNFLYKINLSFLAKIIWYFNRLLFHVDIDYRASLSGGFVITHGLGLVIGRNVQSKGRLKVYQGVTLGGSGKIREIDGNLCDMPVLGEGVIVYTDAKIFGPVIIGNHVQINAGTIVTKDVEKGE